MEGYRLVGAILLALSGFFGAYLANQKATYALRQAEGWLALLRYVKSQVDCFALPMGRILEGCERSVLRECGYGEEKRPEDLEELLAHSAIRDGETERIVRGFAREFGKSYREEQTKGCAYYCELLSERREALASQLPTRKKMNSTLWISGALAVVILLI